jgi:Phage integrase, N-terminal SAM-like domain
MWVSGTTHSMNLAANSVTFGSTGLADIRASHVEAWVKTMQDNGLESTTIRTRFANLRNVFRAAVRDRFMPRDVAVGIKLPRARKASTAMTIPTVQDVGAAIRATDEIEPWYAAFIAVCASAGLRRGEPPALRVSDVEFMRKKSGSSARCSGPMMGGWRSAARSMGRSARSASRTAWRRFSPSTCVCTDPATTRIGGLFPGARVTVAAGARSHGDAVVAQGSRQGGHRLPVAQIAALLRLGSDRGRLRRRDGATGPRSCVSVRHPGHVQPPVA